VPRARCIAPFLHLPIFGASESGGRHFKIRLQQTLAASSRGISTPSCFWEYQEAACLIFHRPPFYTKLQQKRVVSSLNFWFLLNSVFFAPLFFPYHYYYYSLLKAARRRCACMPNTATMCSAQCSSVACQVKISSACHRHTMASR